MDLIEYVNKFIELDWLIRTVYSGTEKGIHVGVWGLPTYNIYTDIPNWYTWSLDITKSSKNSKGYVIAGIEPLMKIGGKYLYFGFRLDTDDKKYLVSGFEYW